MLVDYSRCCSRWGWVAVVFHSQPKITKGFWEMVIDTVCTNTIRSSKPIIEKVKLSSLNHKHKEILHHIGYGNGIRNSQQTRNSSYNGEQKRTLCWKSPNNTMVSYDKTSRERVKEQNKHLAFDILVSFNWLYCKRTALKRIPESSSNFCYEVCAAPMPLKHPTQNVCLSSRHVSVLNRKYLWH